MKQAVLILDCGATSLKACLVDTTGAIISSHSLPNETAADSFYEGGLIWDINEIWNKLAACSRKTCSWAQDTEIVAVTVTTFGVDGAPMKKNGELCYPVISWQCSRTDRIEKNISKYFEPEKLYQITGLQSYHFNTIHKLIWFKENRPDVLKEMDYYILMPSLILQRISGEFVTDTTMAGTTMLMNNRERRFSEEVLKTLKLSSSIFPQLTEPGTIIGKVKNDSAEVLGIKAGIPVIAAGHDTQFAVLGSGAGVNQPVLSSGTWEILMVRAQCESLQMPSKNSGVTIEVDTQPGLVNLGVQWVASGVLEWINHLFYPDQVGSSRHAVMIQEAESISPGSSGVTMIPELFRGGISKKPSRIEGFTHETTRAHIYHAALEALCYYTRLGLDKLQQTGAYQSKDIICVGGGSRNQLWNQMRADVLGIPVKSLDMKETTSLGAAITAFTGLGIYNDLQDAFANIKNHYEEYHPGKDSEKYKELYSDYKKNYELS